MESSPWASGPSSLPPHCPLSLSAAGCRGRPAWDSPQNPPVIHGGPTHRSLPRILAKPHRPQLVSWAPNSSRASSSFAFFCKINHQEGGAIMEQNRTLQLRQRSGSGTGLEEARTEGSSWPQIWSPTQGPSTLSACHPWAYTPPLGCRATHQGLLSALRHPPCPVQWGGEKPAMAAPPSRLSQIGRS